MPSASAILNPRPGSTTPGKAPSGLGVQRGAATHPRRSITGSCVFREKALNPTSQKPPTWFERAATAGNPVAMNRLARIYAHGRGREQNFAAAAGWHLIARTFGVPDFALDRMVETLDDLTMEEARKLAEQYSATLMAPTENPEQESP